MTEIKKEKSTLKVKSTTNPNILAGAICKDIEKGVDCELVAIGSGPISQAVKAIIVTNRLVASSGKTVYTRPSFQTLKLKKVVDGKEEDVDITAIKFKIIVEE